MTLSRHRRGATLIETFVSLMLLATTVSLVGTLAVRNLRVMADGRAHRLAVDELSNRLAVLTAVPADELAATHEELNGAPLTGPLSEAEVEADFAPDGPAQRVTLTLRWPEGRRLPPVTLAGWSYPSEEGQP